MLLFLLFVSDVESANMDKNEIVLKTLAVFPTPSRRWRLRTSERPGEFRALLASVRFGQAGREQTNAVYRAEPVADDTQLQHAMAESAAEQALAEQARVQEERDLAEALRVSAIDTFQSSAVAALPAGGIEVVPSAPPLELMAQDPPGQIFEQASTPSAQTEPSQSDCIICMDAKKDSVCVPCGHNAGCFECLSTVKSTAGTCPVCRAELQQVIRLYAC